MSGPWKTLTRDGIEVTTEAQASIWGQLDNGWKSYADVAVLIGRHPYGVTVVDPSKHNTYYPFNSAAAAMLQRARKAGLAVYRRGWWSKVHPDDA